jgi:hypothetical protein
LTERLRIAHLAFESANGIFDGFPSLPHFLGMLIKLALQFFQNIFTLPTSHATFLVKDEHMNLLLDGLLKAGMSE